MDVHYQVKHELYSLGHLTTNARSLHRNLACSAANQTAHAIVAIKKQFLRSPFGHNDILFEK